MSSIIFSLSSGGAAITQADLGTIVVDPLDPVSQSTGAVDVFIRHDFTHKITGVKVFVTTKATSSTRTDALTQVMETWPSGTGDSWGGISIDFEKTHTLSEGTQTVLRGDGQLLAFIGSTTRGHPGLESTWVRVPEEAGVSVDGEIGTSESASLRLRMHIPATETTSQDLEVRLGVRYTYTT